MLKIFYDSLWQLLQFTKMRQYSLLQLILVPSQWFRVYSLFDITTLGTLLDLVEASTYAINSPSLCAGSQIAELILLSGS